MIDGQTRAAITPADEARAAKFLARGDADFPELAGQAAMIEAQTVGRLFNDLQTLRFSAFAIRPGHSDAGVPA